MKKKDETGIGCPVSSRKKDSPKIWAGPDGNGTMPPLGPPGGFQPRPQMPIGGNTPAPGPAAPMLSNQMQRWQNRLGRVQDKMANMWEANAGQTELGRGDQRRYDRLLNRQANLQGKINPVAPAVMATSPMGKKKKKGCK